MTRTKKLLLTTGLASLVVVLAADRVRANSTSANLNVSATIAASCIINNSGSPGSAFAYDALGANATTPYTASSTASYTCTTGSTPTSFALDQGLAPGAASTAAAPVRRMASGSNRLSYNIFSSSANQATATAAVAWGSANGPTLSAGTGAVQNLTVYFDIPAGQNSLPAGTYNDIVVETLSF